MKSSSNKKLAALISGVAFGFAGVLPAQVPQVLNYQGRVVVAGVNFNGPGKGQFRFALLNTDGSTTYWSNDGTSTAGSAPTAAVPLTVTNGLYSVQLGDTTLTGMTVPLPASVFSNTDVRLRVWFDDGIHGVQQFSPDQRISAAGYAFAVASDGNQNTAVGSAALAANIAGSSNTAIGYGALNQNSIGSSNVAIGISTLQSATGSDNVAVGESALSSVTTGTSNVAIGPFAGGNVTTGSSNIIIYDHGLATDTNTIRIGTETTQITTYIAGIRGRPTAVNNAVPVLIDSSGNLGTVNSSRRYKEEIADMGDASARLLALRPVTFRYKKPFANGEKPIQFGLVAEEVADVFPELAVFNDEGQPETVKYQDLTPMLLNEFLKQHRQVQEQQSTLGDQQKKIEDEEATIATQQVTIGEQQAAIGEERKEIQALRADLEDLRSLVRGLSAGGKMREPEPRTPGDSPTQAN
jgi:Chaperone of endosialidase